MAKDVNSLTEEDLEKAAKDFFDLGTIAEMRGITHEELEAVYSTGFSFYNTGRYDDAETIFKFLVMFDHLEQKYWVGLGAVAQVKKEYAKAVVAYSYAGFLDLENPKPQYYAAECYYALGDKEKALSALACLEEYCPRGTEEGKEFRKKASQLKAKVENLESVTEGA